MTGTAVATEEFKMTEIGLLPQDWEVEPFDNVRAKAIGRIPPSIPVSGYQTGGEYPIIDQSTNYIAGYTDDDSRVLREQLPVIIFGDHTRIFKFVNFPFAIGADGTKIIYPNSSAYHPEFLFYFLLSLDIPSRGYNRHFRILREMKIVRPPLPEQEKIAYVLSTVQTAIEKTEAVIRSTKELKKSLTKHLFTYGPVTTNQTENIPLKETEIGLVPEHWKDSHIGKCCKILTGGTPRTEVSEYYSPPEIPWIKSGEVNKGIISSVHTYISQNGLRNSNANILPKDSVVIALAGRGKTRGTTAVLNIECACNQSIACMVPNDQIYHYYLHYYLTHIYRYIRSITGDKDRGGLNLQLIAKIPLFYPPVIEQREIARVLSSLDRKSEVDENKKRALEGLFKTLLSKLMTGRIRVNNLEVPV